MQGDDAAVCLLALKVLAIAARLRAAPPQGLLTHEVRRGGDRVQWR